MTASEGDAHFAHQTLCVTQTLPLPSELRLQRRRISATRRPHFTADFRMKKRFPERHQLQTGRESTGGAAKQPCDKGQQGRPKVMHSGQEMVLSRSVIFSSLFLPFLVVWQQEVVPPWLNFQRSSQLCRGLGRTLLLSPPLVTMRRSYA